jgi:hypothetical protein
MISIDGRIMKNIISRKPPTKRGRAMNMTWTGSNDDALIRCMGWHFLFSQRVSHISH